MPLTDGVLGVAPDMPQTPTIPLDSFGTRRWLERSVANATVRLLPDAGHVL